MNCNFCCKHCGSSAGKKFFDNALSTEEIKKAFKDIAENFNPEKIMVSLTGGEPLMRKDIFEVMKYAHSLGFTRWGMISNGYLINEEIIDKMRESGLKSIDISIDGLDDTHDKLRNTKGAYKQAINAIKLLKKADFINRIRISTTISRENFHQLEEMYKTFIPLDVYSWRLLNVEPIGRAEENQELFLKKDQLIELLNFIKKKRKESEIEISYGCGNFLGNEFEDEIRDYFFFCSTGINVASILYNGDIFVCPSVPRRKELIQGNVKKDSFSDVWKNHFEIFRDKNRTKCDKCHKCENWNECLGGSFHSWDFDKKRPKNCMFYV